MIMTQAQIQQAITEINEDNEINRRAAAKRRHDIYKDGGRAFLIEQIKKEFGQDAMKEMRLTPINLLKKIVNKRAAIYNKPATRKAMNPSDQALIDYYSSKLKIDQIMQKVNRYYTLLANTVIYTRPMMGEIICDVVPNYLYSVVPNKFDQTRIDGFIFSAFAEEGQVTPQQTQPSATGQNSANFDTGTKVSRQIVNSQEQDNEDARVYILWTSEQHQTLNTKGETLGLNGDMPIEDQVRNPIEILPVVNVAKDRDNEAWATQGEDMIDLTMAIQMGWTDVMTIAKHQGFSLLTIVSEDEPTKITVGINKVLWLKQQDGRPDPKVTYVSSQSPLDQYKQLLQELLGLLLTTNDMDPSSIGGTQSAKQFTSGFHALISMADNLQAVEQDKPAMLDAETAHWEVIKRWHNYLIDAGMMTDIEAARLGKFSDDFKVTVQFADIKPLESEDEVLGRVEKMLDKGLITHKGALKKLNPSMDDEAIDQLQEQIKKEGNANIESAMQMIDGQSSDQSTEPAKDENGDVVGQLGAATKDGVQVADVSKTSLNGAQIAQLVDIVTKVAAGLLPRDAAKAMIVSAFFTDEAEAETILGSAGQSFKITQQDISNAPVKSPPKSAV